MPAPSAPAVPTAYVVAGDTSTVTAAAQVFRRVSVRMGATFSSCELDHNEMSIVPQLADSNRRRNYYSGVNSAPPGAI
ncbi:hypothetical protein MMARJ_38130 [Mycobacterium marseillense]|uniref:Uncharacterized protein n=1 Tax=Mycobacterium marseillense TaxID=701042 RepID=A0ABM7JGN0_9MYCO|nr:hypothetical protein MMARJ_38130 [Mycobacterium marseillense]